MIMLFLAPAMSPIVSAGGDTSARTTPDFSVSLFTLDGAGSVTDGTGIEVENATHVARIIVSNSGSADGVASVSLVHRGSPLAGETIVKTVNLGNIPSTSSSNPVLIAWTASPGDLQTLFARVIAQTNDPNSANDEKRIDFNVSSPPFMKGYVTGDSIPEPSGGSSIARIANNAQEFNATVINIGVKDISAVFELEFIDTLDPSNVKTFWSGELILSPGSLYIPAASENLSTSFNGGAMAGIWSLTAKVIYNGTGSWTDEDIVQQRNVEFSDYIAEISTPADRTTEPGLTTTLTFIVTNKGINSDSFAISVSSVLGWNQPHSPSPSTDPFAPGASTTILVPVAVPSNALRSQSDTITVNLVSAGGSYTLSSTARVMAGELFEATIVMPPTTTMVTPGKEVNFTATLTNTGNVHGSFSLTAGLSVNATNWSVELSTPFTGIVNASEVIIFEVSITVPPIQQPLDSSEYNRAGDVLNVWVQAMPSEGGLPSTSMSQIEVRPVIVVDPGLNGEQLELTAEEVIAAKNGFGWDELLPLSVEVRHNLDGALSNTIDSVLTVGNLSFSPLNSGGFSEADRWSTNLSPWSFTGMSLGDSGTTSLGIQGPYDDYPLAGTITIPVTATPTLNGPTIPNVLISEVTRNMTIVVPSIQDAEIIDTGPFDVPLGEAKSHDLAFANTGNDLTSYRLTILDDLPNGWIASLNTSTSTSNTIDDLSADVADYPLQGNSHIANFRLTVTTDPFAPAYTIQPINIKIEDKDTGLLIGVETVDIRVGPFINATLTPTNQTVPINASQMETPLTRVYVTNTGNAPATYSIWLDESQSGDVDFSLETPNQIIIAPGIEDSIKIRMSAAADADSDSFYMATVWVSTDTGVNLSADIVANVSEQRSLLIDAPEQMGILPGQEQVVNFTVTNLGNLAENFDVIASVEGGWDVVPETQSMSLIKDQVIQGSVTVTVPEISEAEGLDDGSVHNLTIRLAYPSTNITAGIANVELVISPMFMLEVRDWSYEMEFSRQTNRTWEATIVNVGNKDVTVNVSYEIFKSGFDISSDPSLDIYSDDWVFVSGPSQLTLPRNSNVTFEFIILSDDATPDLDLTSNLVVTLTPQDTSVEGIEYLNTTLVMSRFFKISDYVLQPPQDGGPVEVNMIYSHIPRGPSTSVAYEFELCSATRLFDFDANGLDEANYPWTFTLLIDEVNGSVTTHSLPLINVDCGLTSGNNRYTLPVSTAWNPNLIRISVDMPDKPNLITEDGWDLKFKLFHPDENAGYTESFEETFRFELDVYADPAVKRVWISEGTFQEGTDSVLSATIRNEGTSQALIFEVDAICSGSTINTSPMPITQLGPDEEITVEWNLTTDKIDWWAQSIDGTCVVELDTTFLSKNVVGNDRLVYEDEVYSWSPDQSSSFVAFVVFTLLSLILGRLTGQNEKFRLFAVYSGILGLGFAFHLINVLFWGPFVLLVAALMVWKMTWSSTDEFRLIHEDYQRARKGVSTLYADHFQALADSRRQLRVILSLPLLGMLGVVLGIPPQLEMNKSNLISLVGYVGIVTIGVWILVKRADSLYGGLYGRLTDIEVKATRIERDLSDPARLLNDLANEGIDLSEIFDEAPIGSDSNLLDNLNIDGILGDEEVRDDA
tara:strand:- start:1738 stop:6618 length:4881 start_codon:yes stop_codon:yes gene_type:complete